MTYEEQHPKLSTRTNFSTFTEKDYTTHIFHTFILSDVENQFTSNQDHEKPYIFQLKIT